MGLGVRIAVFCTAVVMAIAFAALGLFMREETKSAVANYLLAAGCVVAAVACFFPRLWGTPDSLRPPLPGGEAAAQDRAARSQRVMLWAAGGATAGVFCGIATRALVDHLGWPPPWPGRWHPLFAGGLLGKALGAAIGYHLAWRRNDKHPEP